MYRSVTHERLRSATIISSPPTRTMKADAPGSAHDRRSFERNARRRGVRTSYHYERASQSGRVGLPSARGAEAIVILLIAEHHRVSCDGKGCVYHAQRLGQRVRMTWIHFGWRHRKSRRGARRHRARVLVTRSAARGRRRPRRATPPRDTRHARASRLLVSYCTA